MPHTPPQRWRPESPFVTCFRPRGELSQLVDIAGRAQHAEAGTLPTSIAFLIPPDRRGAVEALPGTMSATLTSGRASSKSTTCSTLAAHKTDLALATGARRDTLQVDRLGRDEYAFARRGGATLRPSKGTICDEDTVERVIEKLNALDPLLAPAQCRFLGVNPKAPPRSRRVHTLLMSSGRMLEVRRGGGEAVTRRSRVGRSVVTRRLRGGVECGCPWSQEGEAIGEQCRRRAFNKLAAKNVERCAFIDLGTRARHLPGRPASIAFLPREEQWGQHSS